MPLAFLASLCEGGGPAGPEGENCAIARSLSGYVRFSPPPAAAGAPSQMGPRGIHRSFSIRSRCL